MRMTLHVLLDDRPGDEQFCSEHGLSFYIETGESTLLFDTGHSGKFSKNASLLGIDLKDVGYLVISHGHYDHSGGADAFLNMNSTAMVLLKEESFWLKNKGTRYIGIPERVIVPGDRICYVQSSFAIDSATTVVGRIELTIPESTQFDDFFIQKSDTYVADTFEDELFLVHADERGLVIITACSHRGIANILETARKQFNKPIRAVVGGFHLSGASQSEIASVAEYLDAAVKEAVYTCHCTSYAAYRLLAEKMSLPVHYIETGTRLTL